MRKENQKAKTITRLSAGFLLPIAIGITFCFLLSCGKTSSTKFKQYYVHGEQLYVKHCSNCHQSNGSGLGRVYPPLNTSDFMEKNFEEVICLIRYGKTGSLTVNGIEFNQPMYGIPALSDLEIAEIVTYIYNTWEHRSGIVEVKEAERILETCVPNP